MIRAEQLIKNFLASPERITYNELKTLLKLFGYEELRSTRRSRGRFGFVNRQTKHILRLTKPRQGKDIHQYQLSCLVEELQRIEVIR